MKLGISGQALGGIMDFGGIVRIGLSYGIKDYEIWPNNAPGEGWGYLKRDVDSKIFTPLRLFEWRYYPKFQRIVDCVLLFAYA